jgi:hypothetical protein
MSVAELKRIVDESSSEERRFLRAYLAEAYPDDDTFDGSELDRRMNEMESGKVVSWEQVALSHEALKAKGL